MNRATPLLDWAMSQPRRACLVTDDETYSFGDVRGGVLGAAGALAELGVRAGTRVGLFIDSTPNFVVWQYAVLHLGGVLTPINRAMRASEVEELVARLGIGLVVADTPLDLGPETRVHVVHGEYDAPDVSAAGAVLPAELGPDDPAYLLQTSGSTGTPKGVVLAMRNLSANYDPSYRWIGVGRDDRIMLTLPIFNTYALNQGVNMMAMTGATMRLLRRFTPENAAVALREFEPTFLPLVPTMVTRLRQAEVHHPADIKVGIGAAPSPSKISGDAWTVFPRAHLYFGYGLTEATAIASLNHVGTFDAHVDDFTSSGAVVSGIRLRIDQPTGDDQRGEILIKGDPVMAGYVGTDDPVPVTDGWLHTGDIGFLHEGRLTIVDRLRELIIRGGQNIYPGEVERVLSGHPDVLEAAVVGRPDPDLGELPVAFVTARRGHQPEVSALVRWCADQLAGFKVPVEIMVTDDLPRTPTGKIQKRNLLALVG